LATFVKLMKNIEACTIRLHGFILYRYNTLQISSESFDGITFNAHHAVEIAILRINALTDPNRDNRCSIVCKSLDVCLYTV
jgi:hypothetical protein